MAAVPLVLGIHWFCSALGGAGLQLVGWNAAYQLGTRGMFRVSQNFGRFSGTLGEADLLWNVVNRQNGNFHL